MVKFRDRTEAKKTSFLNQKGTWVPIVKHEKSGQLNAMPYR